MKKNKDKISKANSETEWDGFGDCPICQAMKNGQADSHEGLMKAFKDAGAQSFEEPNFHMTMKTQDKNDLYYDAMDAVNAGDYKSAEKLLLKAKEMDRDYVQTYVGFTAVYSRPKDKKKLHENIKLGYEKVLKKFPKWPKRLEWGDMDNRAYLRAIQYMGDFYLDNGEKDKAEELYRLVLKLNPNDNQGVRYILAGMYAGISGDEVNDMFDEGNKKQNWDKLEELVFEQNKKHKFWKE